MNNLNSVILEGNLTIDPVLKETATGRSVCTFPLASNRYYKQGEEYQQDTTFIDVEVWARQAQVCGEYLKKGRGVRVVGRLKQDRWKDPEGKSRSRLKILAEHIEFKPEFKNRKEGEEPASQEAAEEIKDSVL